MNEQELLSKMVAPGTPRNGKWRNGVIQILVTRACDNSCYACTQGSNLGGNPGMMSIEHFEQAVLSLKGYFGVIGVFGGNPALHPKFHEICAIMRKHVPFQQRGIWCNNPMTLGKAILMRETFNPKHSNLNVHMNKEAYKLFKEGWPECRPVGLEQDSRHSPVHLAMKDLDMLPVQSVTGHDQRFLKTPVSNTEENRNDLISTCDINQHWSALIGTFRGQLRAWFCEVAGAQAMLHQYESDYPDTGYPVDFDNAHGQKWWQLGMQSFSDQVRKHCHECGVPLRGYGTLAVSDNSASEQTTATHRSVFIPKRPDRKVQEVTELVQLGMGKINRTVSYLENSKK